MGAIYKKIMNVRSLIKSTTLKKQGRNTYSGYDYFTPDQIDSITFEECKKEGLLNKYDLKRTPLGLVAQIQVIEIETGESETFELAMEIPEIKATNISQQLGGAMTYSKRYLLMNIYDISDNSLDFDSQEQNKKQPDKKNETIKVAIELMKVQNTLDGVKKVWSDNKAFQTNKEFIDAKEMMKIAITTKQ
jgi:hypothetical protein